MPRPHRPHTPGTGRLGRNDLRRPPQPVPPLAGGRTLAPPRASRRLQRPHPEVADRAPDQLTGRGNISGNHPAEKPSEPLAFLKEKLPPPDSGFCDATNRRLVLQRTALVVRPAAATPVQRTEMRGEGIARILGRGVDGGDSLLAVGARHETGEVFRRPRTATWRMSGRADTPPAPHPTGGRDITAPAPPSGCKVLKFHRAPGSPACLSCTKSRSQSSTRPPYHAFASPMHTGTLRTKRTGTGAVPRTRRTQNGRRSGCCCQHRPG
ncbi:hypothetical protein GA0115254_124319 [Streptomyces sp. Ncost-T10-10d]|nr:hypothetical protein GA0115254_124319 [Streptomyces sp. Ncost-T10-10d]